MPYFDHAYFDGAYFDVDSAAASSAKVAVGFRRPLLYASPDPVVVEDEELLWIT